MNFEDPRLTGMETTDLLKLDEIFPDKGEKNWMVFDEIQNVPEWEKYIRSKQEQGQKILLTGSNASLLSREFGTKLTGRNLSYELFPFSYTEYLTMTGEDPGASSLVNYLESGGFPDFLKYRDEDILFRITEDILYRDVAVRYGIRKHTVLKELLIYLITNNGKLFSYNSLKKLFKMGSPNTASDYVSYFEDSYLLFTVPKFTASLKEQIHNPRKVYTIDTGLANVNSLSFSEDLGRKLENIVYLHLRKKYRQIRYYSGSRECDFVVLKKNKATEAIQVCFELNLDNMDRELNGLYEAMDHCNLKRGCLITLEQEDRFLKNKMKIEAIPAWKWLMERSVNTDH
jgi:predicted AAA+ superfamily ATPase